MMYRPLLALFVTFKCLFVLSFCVSGLEASGSEAEGVIARGEAVFQKLCQDCHGVGGQGVQAHYPDPLTGDLSVKELAKLVIETMPEENPDACVGVDAEAVAEFMHARFYSEAAQVRNRPPRVILSRLTAEQLRQSLADLYGSMGRPVGVESRRGLQGRYYNGARRKNDEKKIDRVDPVLEFDFGDQGPGEEIDAKDFGIVWNGSLKIDRSGRYELILRSTCSCTMDFGAERRVLVNNHVQSAGRDEFRRVLYLTGGRAYPLEIEFSQRKRKTEQPPAKISLSWIPPGGQEEVIPESHLIPVEMPSSFALQTKLPPDDRSYGYERGTAIDRAWEESTTNAAIEFSQIAIDELYPNYLRKHRDDSDDNRGRLRAFLHDLIETAFRGPVDESIRSVYIDRQIDQAEDDGEAIKRVLLVMLKSPRFLYPTLDVGHSPSRRAANRLALTMHDSLPADDWLVKKAQQDQLETEAAIRNAAERMVEDYRVQAKSRELVYQWFDLGDLGEIVKDSEQYPNFDQALVGDLRSSFDTFIDEVLWSEKSDFRQLLRDDWMFTNHRIEAFYGDAWKSSSESGSNSPDSGGGLNRSIRDSEVHVGLLTHPLLMSHLAYHETTSPIHRGVFLTRHVLGRVLRPPNEAFTPLNPALHPNLTTRQRVELQTGEVNCQVCHQTINSLGFAMENFDGVGRFRQQEQSQPIDARGSYRSRSGQVFAFEGARELGDFLASSEEVQRSIVEATFEHFVKQPITAYGDQLADQLTDSFRASDYNFRQLVVSIAVVVAQHSPADVPSGASVN
ncbi:MAG: DUF1588 domain-containing protein [Planctomycetaceae bacterium]|nr:DUF1588 domain-containing protein [Planctomycetaceae bacterium]